MYSEKVERFAKLVQKEIVIPDEIVMREGISCGDAAVAQGERNGDTVRYLITVTDGCLLAKAMASYLNVRGSGRRIGVLDRWVRMIRRTAKHNEAALFSFWEMSVIPERLECFLSAVEILGDLLDRLRERKNVVYQMKDTEKDLDCDACARSSSIVWSDESRPPVVMQEEDEDSETPDVYREKWCRVSKIRLDAEERDLVKELADGLTQDDMAYLRHEKMAQCVFSNLRSFGFDDLVRRPPWKAVHYQIHRKAVVKREVEAIGEFLKGIDASFIKGAATGRLYNGSKVVRTHLDYDVLCFSESAAWATGCFLQGRGFLIFKDVFSLKRIETENNEVLQGHYHMQKILDDQYKIVVDVSFPGFPVGRIGLFRPRYAGLYLSNEDQFIVTLCHAFKHKNVFMKDLNDLFLMVTKWNLDRDTIVSLVKTAKLEFFLSVALNYLCEQYFVSSEEKNKLLSYIPEGWEAAGREIGGWPYEARAMLAVKKRDLERRKLEQRDHPRIHLLPLTMFRTRLENGPIAFRRFGNARLVVTGMGIFLDKKTFDSGPVDRNELRKGLGTIIKEVGVDKDNIAPFAIAPRTGAWFF